MLIVAVGLFIYELISFTQLEDRLPGGITVGAVAVGGLSQSEASIRIEGAYTSPVTLYYRDSPINLIPDEIGFTVNTDVMLAAARASDETAGGFWGRFFNYMIGRGEIVLRDIPLAADYQRNALRARLETIARVYDRAGASFNYDLDSLMISSTGPSYQLDIDAALEAVDWALRQPSQRAVDLPVIGSETAGTSLFVLKDLLLAYLDSVGFIYDGQSSVASIFILDLCTGEEINIQGDVAYSGASTNKVGIMLDLYRTLNREPNRDEAFLMANSMLCSNNSSSNRMMELYLGNGNIFSGIASVSNNFQYIGAKNTFLIAPYIDGSANQQLGRIATPPTNPNPNFNTYPDEFNQTTAEDMGTIMSLIYDCAEFGSGLMAVYPDGQYTQRECRQMLELMSANNLNRLLQAGIPPDIRISHKNGWVPGALAGARGATTGEAGIIFSPNGHHYVIAVYLWEDGDTTGFTRWPVIEEISRATWNYFNPENPLLTRRTDLPPAASECITQDGNGTILSYNYLPPYDVIDLNNINGWRNGTETTPQPLPNAEQ
jgi:hypothetical protein